MHRKQFLKTSLLATGAYFLPNVVLALDKSGKKKITDLIPGRMLVAQPDLTDYKYNTDGEAFFNTQLSFFDTDNQLIPLLEKHYLTHQADGYGSPALYFDGNNYFVFVTTLFKSYKMNGFVFKYNRADGFEKQTIYQHENMGWYAFWGQCIDKKPALYHYNYGNMSMMRSQPLLAENWETERIYICTPDQAELLYQTQLKDVNYHTQAHQFGFTYPKITDGYYTYLKFLDQINEVERTAKKNIEAEKETKYPTFWSSKKLPTTYREIRNRQSLASETGGCGCADKIDYTEPSDKHTRLIKITNTKAAALLHNSKSFYPTTIGYYDRNNHYHNLPDKFYCWADNEASKYPNIVFDGENYEVYVESLSVTDEHHNVATHLYTHNPIEGFTHKIINNAAPSLFAMDNDGQPPLTATNANSFSEADLSTKNEPVLNNNPTVTKYEPQIIYPFLPEEIINVLQPVFCEGDDLSYLNSLNIKPKVLYREIPGTKIEIPNMPAYKSQDTMGECRAFALRTILQKRICDKFSKRVPDCKNPPAEYDVSSFGLMEYTYAEKKKEKTFDPFGNSFNEMYDVLNNVMDSQGVVILESCNPFTKLVDTFTTNGIPNASDIEKYNKFVNNLKKLYSDKNVNNTEAGITNCQECLTEINQSTGLNATIDQLKAALKKETFGQFMYSLFFDSLNKKECRLQYLLSYYDIKAYPDSKINAKPVDLKNKIIDGLKRNPPSPVLTPAICLRWKTSTECEEGLGHSMVVAGYKRVCEIENPGKCKDLFKIHNSWGESWQKMNNDGWVDADVYTSNFIKEYVGSERVGSGTVLWIE